MSLFLLFSPYSPMTPTRFLLLSPLTNYYIQCWPSDFYCFNGAETSQLVEVKADGGLAQNDLNNLNWWRFSSATAITFVCIKCSCYRSALASKIMFWNKRYSVKVRIIISIKISFFAQKESLKLHPVIRFLKIILCPLIRQRNTWTLFLITAPIKM